MICFFVYLIEGIHNDVSKVPTYQAHRQLYKQSSLCGTLLKLYWSLSHMTFCISDNIHATQKDEFHPAKDEVLVMCYFYVSCMDCSKQRWKFFTL